MARRAADLPGESDELVDLRELGRIGERLAKPLDVLSPAALGDPVLVLARQQAGGEGAEGRETQPDVLVEAGVLDLDPPAVHEVVLGLLHDRLAEVVPLGDLPRSPDLLSRPLGGSPVQRPPGRNDVGHRPYGLLDRGLGIGAMAVHDVDVVELETLEGLVHRFEQVLAIEREEGVRDVAVDAPEVLRRHEIAVTRPPELLQGLPHHGLRLPTGVDLGIVEEVDTSVVCGTHAFETRLTFLLATERQPRPIREQAGLDP